MAKINIIRELGNEALRNLMKVLLEKMGLQNIKEDGWGVRAEENSAFGILKHAFIMPDEQLSGNVPFETIKDIVNDARSEETFNVVTIVSNQHISTGFQTALNKALPEIRINYIGRDDLVALVDARFPDYWRHDDTALIEYEHQYAEVMEKENQLKLLHLSSDKFKRLRNIYIQPTLIEEQEEPKTHMLVRKRADMNELIKSRESVIVSGQAGTGKTTLLYNVGLVFSKENSTKTDGKKYLPVFVTAMDLINAQKDVKEVLLQKTATLGSSIDELNERYQVVLLVDSIDEFDSDRQKNVIRKLVNLSNNKGIRFILTTRSEDRYQEHVSRKEVRFFDISRFNNDQIRRFVNAFLPDEEKASDLLDSLRENKIIERLPITPLTLSLISILFDESDYEVPATITDIYDQFNSLVVGRAIVSNKIEFIDVAFRERILSMYGYLLMNKEDHQPLTYEEFIKHFVEIYNGKSKQIKGATLEEGLEYLVKNTGILYIKDNRYVCFAHDTYMEYYAAVEYFNFYRDKEETLIDNFFDLMWQNVAVFYAGMTKDMDRFAMNINAKLKTASRVAEYISGIQGAGYLLQALYLSDDQVRRDVIITALDLSLSTNEAFKVMATLPDTFFRNYRIPLVQIMSMIHFYEMFNSLTLKTPLEMSFDMLKAKYESSIADKHFDMYILPSIGYQLACLAFTLDSKRLGNDEPLTYLIGQRALLSDVNINSLVQVSMELLDRSKYKELLEQIRKDYRSLKDVQKELLNETLSKSRFSALDTIHPYRKVKLFVEGRTDALILEHAFITLTHGQFPYWNVEMATQNGTTGSTHAVSKAIEAGINYSEKYDFIIGIYDHDKAGLSAFNYLKKDYNVIEERCIKQNNIKSNIYMLCVPVPGEMQQYIQKKQELNYFEIEHYFGHDYLRKKEMIREGLPNCEIYEVFDSKKVAFANAIKKENDPALFRMFVDLFRKIDQITGVRIDYDEQTL